jgi:excisionase family DNA binding protein
MTPVLIRPKNAAEILGISESYLYELVGLGKIEAIRPSSTLTLFDPQEIKEALIKMSNARQGRRGPREKKAPA